MKCVIQRVLKAELKVESNLISQINKGLVVFFGVEKGDNEETCQKVCKKILNMRIFEDENGKMNFSVKDVNGQVLIISQFTLFADCSHGNRPSFFQAEVPELAEKIYEKAVEYIKNESIDVQKGVFGADMKINQLNDGPVTIILDSKIL